MSVQAPQSRAKHRKSALLPDTGGRQLVALRAALRLVGASQRTYYRHPHILPPPIRRGGRLYFFLDEIYALLERLRAERDALLAHPVSRPSAPDDQI